MMSALSHKVLYLCMVDTEMLGPTDCARAGAAQTPSSPVTITSAGTSAGASRVPAVEARKILELFIEGNLQRLQKLDVLRRDLDPGLARVFLQGLFIDANV